MQRGLLDQPLVVHARHVHRLAAARSANEILGYRASLVVVLPSAPVRVPVLPGGEKIGRTQGGNNNAYCQNSGRLLV